MAEKGGASKLGKGDGACVLGPGLGFSLRRGEAGPVSMAEGRGPACVGARETKFAHESRGVQVRSERVRACMLGV